MGRGRWTQSPLSPHLPALAELELFRQLVTARAARATGPIGGAGDSHRACARPIVWEFGEQGV